MPENKPIIFFDGYCGLCNRFIDFLLKTDKKRNLLLFAPLQGKTAQKHIPNQVLSKLNTVVFLVNEQLYFKSTGVLNVIDYLPWPYRLFKIFWLVPTAFRNKLYDIIAQNRYKWFGKKETCRLPSASEKAKFLD